MAAASQSIPLLAYESLGDGPPMMLIHGFASSRYTWRHLVKPLAHTRRVVAVDLKGCGASPIPRDDRYSMFDQATHLVDLIEHLDLRQLTLVGHSFGGGVAVTAALNLLKNQPSRLRRLVLIASIGFPQPIPLYVRLARWRRLSELGYRIALSKPLVRLVLGMVYGSRRRITRDQVDEYYRQLTTTGRSYAVLQTARQIVPPDPQRLIQRYTRLHVPTLLIWGDRDRIVPPDVGRRFAQTLPNAELVIMPGVGHAPQEETPYDTMRIMNAFHERVP